MERYLKLIKNHKYRTAMTQLRTSSHTLAIEYGRYTRPKTKLEDRYCLFFPHILEDEKHFLVECIVNKTERDILLSKVEHLFQTFSYLDKEEKFIFLLNSKDQQVLTWLVNLYITRLKREIKSWYNFVTGYNSQSSADKYMLLISIFALTYVCVLICVYLCVCMHVYICMCIYMGCIYMFMRRVCIHARAPYFNVLRFYVI